MKYEIINQWVKISMVRDGYGPYISDPKNAVKVLKKYFRDKDREEFIVIGLDTRHKISVVNCVSIGSLNLTIVNPREVFKPLILSNCIAFIISHNHPSGDPTPSPEDKEITKRLKECGEMMGIKLLDHIIFADKKRFIFSENGLIK